MCRDPLRDGKQASRLLFWRLPRVCPARYRSESGVCGVFSIEPTSADRERWPEPQREVGFSISRGLSSRSACYRGAHEEWLMTADELIKLRQAYAWEWFKYHAGQRISMFNYFLVAVGILASAFMASWKLEPWMAQGIGILGMVWSIAFLLLDVRNRQLVHMGEDVLEHLERHDIFTTAAQGDREGGGAFQTGLALSRVGRGKGMVMSRAGVATHG